MVNVFVPPRIHGFGVTVNDPPIARKPVAPVRLPLRQARDFDRTSPFFYPCWVMGESESRLGYVVVLSYPSATVNVPGVGLLDVAIKKLKFITNEKGKNNAYALMDLDDKPCAGLIVVPSKN